MDAEIDSTIPRATASTASSGALHRDSGTPDSAGSSQASALTPTTATGGKSPRPTGPWTIFQAGQALLGRTVCATSTPAAPPRRAARRSRVLPAVRGQQHDLCAGHHVVRGGVGAGTLLQRGPILCRQLDHIRRTASHHSLRQARQHGGSALPLAETSRSYNYVVLPSTHAKAVEDAVMAGATAALEYMQRNAGFSRVGHHGGGAGRWIDAPNFVVAQFLQHDSRDKDPQLHVHQAILNRILCSDGMWRSLDSRAIHTLRAAAGAIAERVMEAHLTRTLGVEFATRPDGKAREILGVPQEVMDLFSSRRRAVTAKTAELIAAYRDANGREPTPAERYYIAQQATLATRAGKSHDGETRAEQIARWTAQCRTILAGGLARVARDVLDRAQQAQPAATWSPRDVAARALAAVSETKQAWSRSALVRAISDALPGNLRVAPEQVEPLLEGLTDAALEQANRRHRRPTTRRTCPRPSCWPTASRPTRRRRARSTRPTASTPPSTPSARPPWSAAPRRCPPRSPTGFSSATPRPASPSATTRPPRCAACSPPARRSRS